MAPVALMPDVEQLLRTLRRDAGSKMSRVVEQAGRTMEQRNE